MPVDGRCTTAERKAIGQALFQAWRLPIRNAATEADMVCAALEDLWAEEARAGKRTAPPAAAPETGEAPATAAAPAPVPLAPRRAARGDKPAADRKPPNRRGQPAARTQRKGKQGG